MLSDHIPALTFVAEESQDHRTVSGAATASPIRNASAAPAKSPTASSSKPAPPAAANPPPSLELRSYLGQFLEETSTSMGADDEGRFPLRLLHFRRTFVEKMFAIHGKVEMLKRDGQPLGTYARHYYDLIQLAAQPEVIAMLKSAEYAAIKADYDEISRTHFAEKLFPPRRDELRQKRRSVSAAGTGQGHQRRIRGAMQDALLTVHVCHGPRFKSGFLRFEASCNVNIGTQIVST